MRRAPRGIVIMLALGAMSAACGLDWAVPDSVNGDDPRDGGDGSQFGSGDDGGPGGPTRVCSKTRGCYADEYCDYADGKCGSSADGICKRRPTTCTEAAAPQCGCDGQRYTMACEAHRAGTDDSPGTCSPNSPEYFACGTTKCQVGKEYCLVTGGLLTPRVYACRSFNGCSAADCSCPGDLCIQCAPVNGGGTVRDCSL